MLRFTPSAHTHPKLASFQPRSPGVRPKWTQGEGKGWLGGGERTWSALDGRVRHRRLVRTEPREDVGGHQRRRQEYHQRAHQVAALPPHPAAFNDELGASRMNRGWGGRCHAAVARSPRNAF